MQRAGAAEGDEGEFAGVVPALDGDDAQGAEHLSVHDRDRIRRIDAREGALCRLGVELQAARERRRQPPEEQVGIRHGRPRPAAAVAGGTWIGAGALGPNAQGASAVSPDDRPAPRADRVQVDRGQPQRETSDLALGGKAGAAVHDQRDVGRGPAHVERDRVLEPGPAGEQRCADRPRGRPRQERHRRMRGCLLERRNAARRPHHERLRQTGGRSPFAETLEIPRDDRPEICVDGGRRCPLVLAKLGRDLVRGDHPCARQPAPQLGRDRALVI